MPFGNAPSTPQTYPTHRVLGVVPNESSARQLVDALREQRMAHDLWVIHQGNSRGMLDPDGNEGGFWHGLARLAQKAVSYESDQMEQYQQAIDEGRFVIGVDLSSDPDKRDQAAGLFAAHGGHHVRYYGPMAIENMHHNPSAL